MLSKAPFDIFFLRVAAILSSFSYPKLELELC
jgi:hypothetical protein